MVRSIGLIGSLMSMLLSTHVLAGTKVNANVNLGGSRAATWYLPDSTPTTWVYLQHGFSRNKGRMDDMATHYMDSGLMVLSVDCNVQGGNASLARDVADDIIDNPPTPPNGFTLPSALVVSGHSAGGLFATHMGARFAERGYSGVKGQVLLDPVDASSAMQNNMQAALDAGQEVYAILANPSSCNASSNGLVPLQSLSAPFVGIHLTDNSKHTDAEGSSTGFPLTWICGSPNNQNIAYLQDFAANWAIDLGSGNKNPAYYIGGAKIQQLEDANDGELIKAFTGPVCGNGIIEDGEQCDGGACCDSGCNLRGVGTVCRGAAAECDVAETCDGSTAQCPADEGKPNGTPCGDGGQECWGGECVDPPGCGNGVIEPGEECDGGACCSADCRLSSAGVECRSSAGECDIAEYCDGSAATCPDDQFEPDGTACSFGICQAGMCSDQPVGWVVLIEETDVAGADGSETRWVMEVPNGATDVEMRISGGFGDADLYVNVGTPPTTRDWDCRPYRWGNSESCSFTGGGTYHIMLRGYDAYSGVDLLARYYFPN